MNRELLLRSDRLLDRIELLLLDDQRRCPIGLATAVVELEGSVKTIRPGPLHMALRGAHERVLAAQKPLLSLVAPPLPQERTQHHNKVGHVVQDGWLTIDLPLRRHYPTDAAWREAVEAIVDRLFERWAYATEKLKRTVREHHRVFELRRHEQVAFDNYQLCLEKAAVLLAEERRAA